MTSQLRVSVTSQSQESESGVRAKRQSQGSEPKVRVRGQSQESEPRVRAESQSRESEPRVRAESQSQELEPRVRDESQSRDFEIVLNICNVRGEKCLLRVIEPQAKTLCQNPRLTFCPESDHQRRLFLIPGRLF